MSKEQNIYSIQLSNINVNYHKHIQTLLFYHILLSNFNIIKSNITFLYYI